MEKFSIARPGIPGHGTTIFYLRIEPNGNRFWDFKQDFATQFEHEKAENELLYIELTNGKHLNCYLVPATNKQIIFKNSYGSYLISIEPLKYGTKENAMSFASWTKSDILNHLKTVSIADWEVEEIT